MKDDEKYDPSVDKTDFYSRQADEMQELRNTAKWLYVAIAIFIALLTLL